METNTNGGIQLVPSDPMLAARMRVKMQKFGKLVGNMHQIVLTRGLDVEKILKYKEETLPIFEAMCTEIAGKFLLGTDDLTLLDIHVGPMWEIMYLLTGEIYDDVDQHLQIKTNAPNWCAYMEKFRNHSAIKPYRFNKTANNAQGARGRAMDPSVKCPFSLAVLEGAWPEQEE